MSQAHPGLLATPPKLQFFIARDNGTCIPLIPADELPHSVRLQGVPRFLPAKQAERMQIVARLPFPGKLFLLEDTQGAGNSFPPSTLSPEPVNTIDEVVDMQALVDDAVRKAEADAAAKVDAAIKADNAAIAALAATDRRIKESKRVSESPESSKSATSSKSSGSSTSPISVKSVTKRPEKIYCTHWIRTGECDFTLQGCMYKHEMPNDAILAVLGFRDQPKWPERFSRTRRLTTSPKKPARSINAKGSTTATRPKSKSTSASKTAPSTTTQPSASFNLIDFSILDPEQKWKSTTSVGKRQDKTTLRGDAATKTEVGLLQI